ncbi:MAG: hypothetical protein ACOYON_05990 [Fimbriimonas sp.]
MLILGGNGATADLPEVKSRLRAAAWSPNGQQQVSLVIAIDHPKVSQKHHRLEYRLSGALRSSGGAYTPSESIAFSERPDPTKPSESAVRLQGSLLALEHAAFVADFGTANIAPGRLKDNFRLASDGTLTATLGNGMKISLSNDKVPADFGGSGKCLALIPQFTPPPGKRADEFRVRIGSTRKIKSTLDGAIVFEEGTGNDQPIKYPSGAVGKVRLKLWVHVYTVVKRSNFDLRLPVQRVPKSLSPHDHGIQGGIAWTAEPAVLKLLPK